MTAQEYLKTINSYPVPALALQGIALVRGIDLTKTLDIDTLKSKPMRLAIADVKKWISGAPDVVEGGVNISFSNSEREILRMEADSVYYEIGGADDTISMTTFGSKGEDL